MDFETVLIYDVVILLVNIHDARTHLSEHLSRLDTEREIVLCKRNVAVPAADRVVGLEKGHLHVPDSCNDPLPEEMEALYNGEQQ
mgnify:CR=1 FL=1